MIFVTLGTQDKPFGRLLKLIEEQIEKGNICNKVVVQAGYTKFVSDKMEIVDYMPTEEFNKLVGNCELLITHGGVGNILTGLKASKKVIAVPRLAKYGEHTNDHQLQIVNNFFENGYILKLDDGDNLDVVMETVSNFIPKKWIFNNKQFVEKLSSYIDNN